MRKLVLICAIAVILVATFGCYSPNPENKFYYLQIIPQDGARLFKPPESIGWRATNDTNYYVVEVSSDSDFNNIIYSQRVDSSEIQQNLLAGERWYRSDIPRGSLMMNKIYYWRVKVIFNDGSSRYSSPTNFILGYPLENK